MYVYDKGIEWMKCLYCDGQHQSYISGVYKNLGKISRQDHTVNKLKIMPIILQQDSH